MIKNIIIKFIKQFQLLFSFLPIQNNKVLFYPVNGHYYCNLKYIDKYLSNKNYKLVWVGNNKKRFPDYVIQCKKNTLYFFYHILTAKIVIFNDGFPSYVLKRKEQIYIQTWHGGGAYKKIDKAYKNIGNKHILKRINDKLNDIDYLVCSCERFNNAFRNDTAISSKVKSLNTGMPRNDIFFDVMSIKGCKNKIKEIYNLEEQKIVLYAPTFRDTSFNNDLNMECIKKELTKYFNSDVVIFLRCHPHRISDIFYTVKNKEWIIDVTPYEDMQELLCAAYVGFFAYI